ncbi:MAG: hypothetical protein OEY14_17050, partial [Myxococcales bacterium]|nr:hypothetical protein [Myxococcales bacterium]
MRAHRSIWLTLAVVAFVLGGSWLLGRGPRLSGAPLANVPAGASGMLRIEPAALRASALWQQGVVAQGGDRGLRELQARCGFDPLSSVEDLILFATGGQAHQLQHVGVIARGRFDLARLGACMRSALEDSGGELERTELLGVPAMQGGGGNSRAAFIGDQAVIWGHERVVSRVIRTTRGELESADSDALLHALYAELAPGQPIVA